MPDHTRFHSYRLFARFSLFWQLQLIGWGIFALAVFPLKMVVYGSTSGSLFITAYQLPLSLLLTALLREAYRRTGAANRSPEMLVGLVLVACVTASSIDVLVSIPLNHYFGLFGPADILGKGLFAFRTAVYVIWSLLYFLISAKRAEQRRAFEHAIAGEKLRLQALRYQLNPQFLATSLATIAAEIDQDPAIARAMTLRLTNFYQTTLRHNESGEPTTLREEMELVRAYLEIQRLRFGNTLSIQFAVDQTLLDLPLPPLLLLPLAEKAVQNGLEDSPEQLEITITAQRTFEGAVLLEVARTGRLSAVTEGDDDAASGLHQLRTRLERHYPGQYRFVFAQDSARARATLILPLVSDTWAYQG